MQEARKIAVTDICKKNEVMCSSDEELISLSDKVATLQPVKILNYLLAVKKLLALAMCYGPDENRKNKSGGRPRMVKDAVLNLLSKFKTTLIS